MDLYFAKTSEIPQLFDKTNGSRRNEMLIAALSFDQLHVESCSKVEFLEVLDQRYLLVGQRVQYHSFGYLSMLLAVWLIYQPHNRHIGSFPGDIPRKNETQGRAPG